MTREEKIKVLEHIQAGRLNPVTLLSKTPHFILPANDGSGNVIVISKFGSRTLTKEQFQKSIYNDKQTTD